MPELLNSPAPIQTPARSFPWSCPKCRRREVRRVTLPSFQCQRLRNGKTITVTVQDFAVPRCGNCGEMVFDYEAEEQIARALRGPNLFEFATNELSQDAFICWLATWAKSECRELDLPLHTTAVAFLNRLLDVGKGPRISEYHSIKATRQDNKIDVLLVINGDTAIIIEDKTNSKDHARQLQRYRAVVAKRFPKDRVAAVYFKTGDQCDYEAASAAGYGCFLRRDLLQILSEGKQAGVRNDIFDDFYHHLRDWEEAVQSFAKTPLNKWKRKQWIGFFMAVKQSLGGEGDWGLRSGKSFTFRWHERNGKYLVLHESKLGFSVQVNDESLRQIERDQWATALQLKNGIAGIKIKSPARLGLGNRMRVAVLAEDYRQTDDRGLLDFDKTIHVLKQAEALMDAALATLVSPVGGG